MKIVVTGGTGLIDSRPVTKIIKLGDSSVHTTRQATS